MTTERPRIEYNDRMHRRTAFVAGLAVGYYLGARAGRERYEEIRAVLDDIPVGRAIEKARALGVGVLVNRPIASRPDSAFSIGVQQGVLNKKFRANLADAGVRAGRAETGAEITYSDKIAPRITVQPDLQWVRHAGGDRDARDRFIAALRIKIDLSPTPAE